MIKTVDPNSFNFDHPVMSMIEVHSRGIEKGWLQKTAAVLTKEMADIRPVKDKTYVHLIALGDFEKTGANRNADAFPAAANKDYHHTFVKYGNFYKNHRNKPARGDKIYGNIPHSAYNEKMGRVELIIAIDNLAAPDTVEKIASGKDIGVSMACHVPYDTCSICRNKAKTSIDYCDHITKYASQILDDGRQVYMINDEPKFFDISEVVRPADRIAYTLRKVASTAVPVLSTVTAAEFGITAPIDILDDSTRQYATILQKIAREEEVIALGFNAEHKKVANCMAMPLGMDSCEPSQLPGVFKFLKDARVSLPVEDFFRLIMGSNYSQVEPFMDSTKASLPGIFSKMSQDPEASLNGISSYEGNDDTLPDDLKRALLRVASQGSLDDEPLHNRVTIIRLRKTAHINRPRIITEKGFYLAKEYGKYKLAFIKGMSDATVKRAVLQNFG